MQITIPRWAQLIVIPLIALAVLYLIGVVSHAIFVFLMAVLLALLLNPIVSSLCVLRIPRFVAVPIVYLSFTTIVVLLAIIGLPPLIAQLRALVGAAPEWARQIDQWIIDLQEYLRDLGIEADFGESADRLVVWVEERIPGTFSTVFDLTFNVVGSLATFFLVVIISFYMLFDGRRIYDYLARVLPGDDDMMAEYLSGLQSSFIRYIKGQLLLATSVGLAAGLGVWALGWEVVGIWPQGSQYALLFGFWAGVTEVLPYIGPWIGAAPPVALALFHSPAAALWVALIFFAVQQLENNILVPNIMGATVGVHPLAVIFALLAGAQIAGILGMLAVLPLLAMLKHTMDFFEIRFSRAPWVGDDGLVAALPAARAASTDKELPDPTDSVPAGQGQHRADQRGDEPAGTKPEWLPDDSEWPPDEAPGPRERPSGAQPTGMGGRGRRSGRP